MAGHLQNAWAKQKGPVDPAWGEALPVLLQVAQEVAARSAQGGKEGQFLNNEQLWQSLAAADGLGEGLDKCSQRGPRP